MDVWVAGKRVRVDPRDALGKGGEADVYRLGADQALKLFKPPEHPDYAGLPQRTDIDGRSLRRAANGEEMSDAPAYAESLYPELELGWAPLHAWRTAGFKFIKAPRPELYDL